jgi:hypothetical protein
VDSHDGEVGVRVVAYKLGLKPPPVRQGDFDAAGVVNDVAVRKDEAVWGKDEARPSAARLASRRTLRLAAAETVLDFKVYDRGAYPIGRAYDGARVSIEQLVIRSL